MSPTPSALAAVLDRHVLRRGAGIATVSILVGAIGTGIRAWRRLSEARNQTVLVSDQPTFPLDAWQERIVERFDLAEETVQVLARRSGRNPDEFLAEWRDRTAADRQLFWNTLARRTGDDLLQAATLSADGRRDSVGPGLPPWLAAAGERAVTLIVGLVPAPALPSVLFAARSPQAMADLAEEAVRWVLRAPGLTLAIAVPPAIWHDYLAVAPESRVKSLVKEGEARVPIPEPAAAARALHAAGIPPDAAAPILAVEPDDDLLDAAVHAAHATAEPAQSESEDDHARSAAERFLFQFLESLPETSGRFVLNARLDIPFGPRPMEVDLLCQGSQIAIEIDGYYHFLNQDAYRRDRSKDWELQRLGFVVLRFLAEDVIPQLDRVRDRILDALDHSSVGALP